MAKETEVTTIPQIRQVFYDLYANFPAANAVNIGDLAYATDRLVFYRSNGAAWQLLTIHSSSGTIAGIPAAADMPEGSIYYATDDDELSQVQAGAWQVITVLAPITVIRKTANQAVNNSIVLVNDTHLLFPIAANEAWYVEFLLLGNSPTAAPDFDFTIVVPVGATGGWWLPEMEQVGANMPVNPTAFAVEDTMFASAVTWFYILKVMVINGANAGNVQLQWAQNIATVEDTQLLTNSHLRAFQIA